MSIHLLSTYFTIIQNFILFWDLREPIIYEKSFGVYNNFQPVASESDRKFGIYQFGYFGTGRRRCKNTHGAKPLPVICLKDDSSRDEIKLPFDLKNFIIIGAPIGGFIITFATWYVAATCCNIGNCIKNCSSNDEE